MTREAEECLVALLEAAASPLSRRAIFERAGEHFVDEEELAKTLGRLVASGGLVRSMRARLNKSDEAVYSTPAAARLAAIAAAARKNDEAELAANDGRELLSAPPEERKEPDMPRGIYPRKPRKAKAEVASAVPEAKPEKKARRGRKAGPGRASTPRRAASSPTNGGASRFGYFSDGSLHVDCPECKGILSAEDVNKLRDFTQRFQDTR